MTRPVDQVNRPYLVIDKTKLLVFWNSENNYRLHFRYLIQTKIFFARIYMNPCLSLTKKMMKKRRLWVRSWKLGCICKGFCLLGRSVFYFFCSFFVFFPWRKVFSSFGLFCFDATWASKCYKTSSLISTEFFCVIGPRN